MDNEMQKVLFASIAEVGLQNGYSPENIIQAMMQQGASRDFATRAIEDAKLWFEKGIAPLRPTPIAWDGNTMKPNLRKLMVTKPL